MLPHQPRPYKKQRNASRGKRIWRGLFLLAACVLAIYILQSKLRPDTPLHDVTFYVDPNSNAARQATRWRTSTPENARLMDKLAKLPTARWLTAPDQLPDIESYVNAATRSRKVPVLVAYYFPGRDCGKYSAGGAPNEAAYRDFIGQFAEALGNARTIVILEPDALPGISASNDQGNPCVARQEQANRYALLKQAVNRLKQQKNTNVYIDAGNSAWITNHKQLASWLEQSGVTDADGFSLNVSNFQTTADTIRYGEKVARYVRDAHFVIDTSRNGLGPYTNTQFPTHSWCNPPGRALGHYPTTKTGNRLVDAYLYIKYPGESDGQDPEPGKCANGPAAGVWWPEYALELIERWPKDLQP